MAERHFSIPGSSAMTMDWRLRLALGTVVMLLLLGYTAALESSFTARVPGGNDFYPRWAAWRIYFTQGLSPYSDANVEQVNVGIYGRPALPGEDQNQMVYPFYSFVWHGPFALLPYTWARALFMVLQQVAIVAAIALTWRLIGWKPGPWLAAITLIWAVFFYPTARGIILGQFAIFGFFLLMVAVQQMDERPVLAGVALTLTTIKPTLVVLAVPLCILWAARRRQWRFLAASALSLLVLCLISWILLPAWLGEWLYRVQHYADYTVIGSPAWILTHLTFPVLGNAGETAITLAVLAITAWLWWRLLREGEGKVSWLWTFAWTLLATNLILQRTATTNYVLLFPAIFLLFQWAQRRFGARQGTAIIFVAEGISLIALWLLFLLTIQGNQETAVNFLPLPLALVALLPLVPRTVKR